MHDSVKRCLKLNTVLFFLYYHSTQCVKLVALLLWLSEKKNAKILESSVMKTNNKLHLGVSYFI